MTTPDERLARSAERRPRRRWVRRIAIALAIVLAMFAIATARLFIWPPLPDLPGHADAVIELAGPAVLDRDDQAMELARESRASVLVQSTTTQEAGTDRCLPPVLGVTVMCFHPNPGTTRGEAQWIGAAAAEHHWTSVILVTTPDQAWRAQLRLSRCFPGDIYVSTTPLPLSDWPGQIVYQWGATFKALFVETDC